MKIKGRITATLAMAAVLPLAFTGCSGGTSNAGGDVKTLTVLDSYNNEPDKGILQDSIDKCAAAVGVTIERTTVPGKDRMQTVLQRSSSKTLPDVLMLDNPEVKDVAATGALAPLGDFNVDTSPFAGNSLDAVTQDGQVYGLPLPADTLGLFYNKDVLAAAGVQPPKTWDELKAAAAKLTTADRYGLALSAAATYEGSWQFLPFMWTNGGDETKLDSPEVKEALQLYVDLVNSGSVSKGIVNWTQADVKDQFVAGKAAMMINGPWQIPALAKAPEVHWDSVQIPVNKPGQTPTAPLGGMVWTVPRTGDEAKEKKAAEFVACTGSEDSQMSLGKARNTVPVRAGLQEKYIQEVPAMKSFTEQVENARARTGKLGPEWPKAATTIYTAVQLALTGGASVDEAFARAAAG
ncbi:sugar ABC transporter substrate-binding protein [Arthrobacter sp. FW306-06-A]|uniref:sugar ABC transporter substrate-binding protein n=1 Tax=Arthrobacter sp. FW306-06-A TaxID=2879621 RepID=UPI001F17BE43|nr:extracellular solute-binding protein [Arthrobacter sp. FW306-06-A]UKA70710.1 extracellular solute-binding protein [Arthrobacter sp. FW306-06-A]